MNVQQPTSDICDDFIIFLMYVFPLNKIKNDKKMCLVSLRLISHTVGALLCNMYSRPYYNENPHSKM